MIPPHAHIMTVFQSLRYNDLELWFHGLRTITKCEFEQNPRYMYGENEGFLVNPSRRMEGIKLDLL